MCVFFNMINLSEQVKEMYGEINIIYDAIKFIYNSFFIVISLLIALFSVISYTTIKRYLRSFINKERDKLTSNMLEDLAMTKQIMGREYLSEHKYIDGVYIFPVLSHKISFTPNLINKIILTPLDGNKTLEYKAWVKKGQLYIKFNNFEAEKDKGVNWVILYNEYHK
ncbi:hypothetical protein SH1V18_07420 [Vallitalea longa]|uniref:Uncharacterized protein n=1 Tax=Vallitalea longa TaxID=2936439 RepID=A0A9W6DEB9_9FIRM|nr:hypothetical protein [Vallitalea longa]GKX28262.1 hypothetical protein SH1V18_07420 [Vallitalea longa]